MAQNIFIGVLCAVVLAAGVWGWWIDNGRTDKEDEEKENTQQKDEQSEKIPEVKQDTKKSTRKHKNTKKKRK